MEVRIVLHLFEVADRDSSRVSENVGKDRYAFLEEDRVSLGSGGSVREFEYEPGFYSARVIRGYAVFERGGHEDVDFEFQKPVDRDFFGSRIFRHGFPIAFQFGDNLVVQPFRMPYRSFRVRNGHDLRAGGMEDFDHRESGVSRAFDGDGFAFEVLPHDFQILREHEESALRGRAVAPLRSARGERFTGKRAGGPLSDEAGILVDHPSHDFRIGVHVRRRNVGAGSKVFVKSADVSAGEAFEFVFGKFRRVHDDSAFAASERQVEHCGLHAHPCGERHHFVFVHALVEADAPFVRSSGAGVLRPVTGEGFYGSVVHFEDEVRLEHAFGFEEFGYGILFESGERRRVEHLFACVFERGFGIRHCIFRLG